MRTRKPVPPLPILATAAGGYRLRVEREGAGFDTLHDAGATIYQAYAFVDAFCARLTAQGLTVVRRAGGGWIAYARGIYVTFSLEPVSVEGH